MNVIKESLSQSHEFTVRNLHALTSPGLVFLGICNLSKRIGVQEEEAGGTREEIQHHRPGLTSGYKRFPLPISDLPLDIIGINDR